MKGYKRLAAAAVLVLAAVIVFINITVTREYERSVKQYKVDISRVVHELEENGRAGEHETVTGVFEYDGSADFYDSDSEYVIREVGGKLYRIEYTEASAGKPDLLKINLALFAAAIVVLWIILHIGRNIIRPFNRISRVPSELSRGNLTVPLTENKSRYFGKFVWGLDMLREELESAQKKSLEQARDEKTMLLSLSHDIKTPLSAIKLYAGALSRGIYSDLDGQKKAAENISAKADEISGYVTELIRSLSDGFMELQVRDTEFYMSEAIKRITDYYSVKLTASGTDFEVSRYVDCLLRGDPDRLEEVLQNLFENAIKYGDGKVIGLTFADEEDCRLITVSNSGCTLPPDELTHIFESFWRGSNAENKPGSGLGLYICRKLMTSSGGDIFAAVEDGMMKITLVCRKASGGSA